MSKYRIAVLGDKDSVLGFKALGLDVFPAETVEEAKGTLHQLAKENYAVIYLTEQYAAGMTAEVARYKDELTPAIILIPGKDADGNGFNCGKILSTDNKDCLIISNDKHKLVAINGLNDYMVIDTDDVLLICPKNDRKFKDFIAGIAMPGFEDYR